VMWLNDQQKGQQVGGQRNFQGDNPPRGAAINYYLKSAGEVKLSIADVNGATVWTGTSQGRPGINRVQWNLQRSAPPEGRGGEGAAVQVAGGGGGGQGGGRGRGNFGPPVTPGTYIVTMTAGGTTLKKPLTVLQDVWMSER
jgi:hypothetical protein